MYKQYEVLIDEIMNKTPINIDKREGSFVRTMASPVAYELSQLSLDMEDILRLAFIENNYDEYLERRCNEYGLYRKEGKRASGKGTINDIDKVNLGELGRVSQFMYNDLTYNVMLRQDTYTISLESAYDGYIYNIPIGEVLIAKDNDNITLTLDEDMSGGVDRETDEELRERFNLFIRDTQTSGNAAHYRHWATEVSGVHNAKIFPLHYGNGTVRVLVSNEYNLPVDDDILEACHEHISSVMPIGCRLYVENVKPITVSITANVCVKEGTIEGILEKYDTVLRKYLSSEIGSVYYSKLFSLLGELDEVSYITEFKVNNKTIDIELEEDEVLSVSSLDLKEVIVSG